MTEFKALNDEICLLPTNIDSELFKTFEEEFPDDLPIILLEKEKLELFFENMYDIKDIETYNICANVASYLSINDYYPFHYLNGITSREGLHNYYKIPSYYFEKEFTNSMVNEIIKNNDTKFINNNRINTWRLWDGVGTLGNMKMAKWLHKNKPGRTSNILYITIKHGHLELVKWLYDIGFVVEEATGIDTAAYYGRLNIIKWLHKNTNESCTEEAMDGAANNGHLDVVIWLHKNRDEGCTYNAMNYASSYGYLDIVKWLYKNRTEGCTTYAMDRAAENGHLNTVIWLHKNRDEGCTYNAMNYAASHGHLDIVKWLYENRTEGCTTNAMVRAVENGHLDVVEYLESL